MKEKKKLAKKQTKTTPYRAALSSKSWMNDVAWILEIPEATKGKMKQKRRGGQRVGGSKENQIGEKKTNKTKHKYKTQGKIVKWGKKTWTRRKEILDA